MEYETVEFPIAEHNASDEDDSDWDELPCENHPEDIRVHEIVFERIRKRFRFFQRPETLISGYPLYTISRAILIRNHDVFA